MDKCRINIAILESSDLVFEGLSGLLHKSESHYYIYRIAGLDELSLHFSKENVEVIIVNPNFLLNKISEFSRLRKLFDKSKWIGLVYSYFGNDILSRFDDVININDDSEVISKKINQSVEKDTYSDLLQEELSERETEVLVQLVNGLSSKEIADKLNISTHTVNSHRKNIIEKTGIKSLSGLTIYAISKKIIPLDSV